MIQGTLYWFHVNWQQQHLFCLKFISSCSWVLVLLVSLRRGVEMKTRQCVTLEIGKMLSPQNMPKLRTTVEKNHQREIIMRCWRPLASHSWSNLNFLPIIWIRITDVIVLISLGFLFSFQVLMPFSRLLKRLCLDLSKQLVTHKVNCEG